MTTLNQLAQERHERDRLAAELDRMDTEIAATYGASASLVDASDAAVDERVREVDRLRMREAGVSQQLREADAMVARLEQAATAEALQLRDAERAAQDEARIEQLDGIEERLRHLAEEFRAMGLPFPLLEPLQRGLIQRFIQYLGGPPLGIDPPSPGLLSPRHQDRRLSEVFLGAKRDVRGAA